MQNKTTKGLSLFMMLVLEGAFFSSAFCTSVQDSLTSKEAIYGGCQLLGGSISYSYSSFPGTSQSVTTVSLSPAYLYFSSPTFAIGGQMVFESVTSSQGNSNTTTSIFGFGPAIRYYFSFSKILSFASAGLFTQKSKVSSGSTLVASGSNSSISIGLGMDFFLSNALSIEPIIQYQVSLQSRHVRTVLIGVSVASFIK